MSAAGAYLRGLREGRGLSQEELARQIGVAQKTAGRRKEAVLIDHQRVNVSIARLVPSTVSLAINSLAVLRAPTLFCWKLAIGVTEWGHIAALLAALPLLGRRSDRGRRLADLLGGTAVVLALTPLLRALLLARRVPELFATAFGEADLPTMNGAPPRPAPLVARDLIRGVHPPRVQPITHTYVQRADRALELDFYPPRGIHHLPPCVLVVHGGSWQHYNRLQLPALNRYLAAHGYAVAAIDYRLAPTHRFPAAKDDVLAALGFLKDNAASLGIDASRLVLMGRSAGAHLALLVAYSSNDPAIRGVVSLYGPADLHYGYDHPANPAVHDSRGVLEAFLGGNPAQMPATYREASPIGFVGPASPPTLLIHGGRDELVQPIQSERLAARLAQAGRPHLLLRLPWATHAADFNFSGPSGQIITYAVERFLAAVCTLS
jgi:acetyl esterase/lipase